jgi:hypothetical protein
MVTVYTTADSLPQLRAWVATEDRLDELVRLVDLLDERPVPSGRNLLVRDREIQPLLDWRNEQPPFLLARDIRLTAENFLGLVFAKLGNLERSYDYLHQANPTLWRDLQFQDRMRYGLAIDPAELAVAYSAYEDYRLMHNQAVVRHYAAAEPTDVDQLLYFYREAVAGAPDGEHQAYTLQQLAILHIDLEQSTEAEQRLAEGIEAAVTEDARTELRRQLCNAWLSRLTVPYDATLLEQLKTTLWEVLQAYEAQDRPVEAALLLVDAAHVATLSESFAEGLGYVNRAIETFEAADIPELAANAHLRKGMLLYTWAQNGQPQFYRPAAESFQHALRVFTREAAPEVFAEIHQYLGIIYAEIPAETQKKSIWAAVSSSSFQEALQYYTPEAHPYTYAMVCNHYGNALTQYPAAIHTDNHEKALFYYAQALEIRTAEAYPLERAMTLLNYLEAAWHKELAEDRFDQEHYEDMLSKAREVSALTDDPTLRADAQRHLDQLARLKTSFASAG